MTKLFRFYDGNWRCGTLTICHNGLYEFFQADVHKALVITVSTEPAPGAMVLTRLYGPVGYKCEGVTFYINGKETTLMYGVILALEQMGAWTKLYVIAEQAA